MNGTIFVSAKDSFTPDWHPQLGPGLAGFPRRVALPLSIGGDTCWPDFATLVETDDSRQMLYTPIEGSRYSARVVCSGGECSVYFYDDAELLAGAR